MLGWGLMSSRALSMDRDPPLLVGLHRTSLDNTSTSCTEITQCNPISWPTQMPSGVGGHRESSGKRCSHARREQMSGSAAMHVGALQEAKRIWKAASCMKAQEQPKALVLLMGVRDMHGADPSGDPQPNGSIWSHTAPMPTASAKPHTLCGLHFQHSIAIATAEPQPSRHRGRGAVGDPPGKVSAQCQVHPGLKAAVPSPHGECSIRKAQPSTVLGAFPCQPGHVSSSKREKSQRGFSMCTGKCFWCASVLVQYLVSIPAPCSLLSLTCH